VRPVCTVAAQDCANDLLRSALVRPRFCELLTPRVPPGDSDLFFLGLLSLLKAMLEVPMATLLSHIPLDRGVKAVLLGEPSLLRPVFDLVLAHEAGNWYAIVGLSTSLHLDPEESAATYWQAQQWAREMSAGV
jgi:EAL and modified HD-GYP domain-containing signal transduction protein